MGRYAIEELQKKFITDRKRLVVQRKQDLLEEPPEEEKKEDETDASAEPGGSDDESDGSEGEFQPDSDDEELAVKSNEHNPSETTKQSVLNGDDLVINSAVTVSQPEEEKKVTEIAAPVPPATPSDDAKMVPKDSVSNSDDVAEDLDNLILTRPELTKSLAYRLLAMDVGYSSDEGGDEDCAYFVDGVDDTFTSMADIPDTLADAATADKESSSEGGQKVKPSDETQSTLPIRRADFGSLGDRSKLVAAVTLTGRSPDVDDFDNFPFPSTKEIEQQILSQKQKETEVVAEEDAEGSPVKSTKKSTVKVEQVSVATNEAIHVWASAEIAAATLQIPLNEIKSVLRGDYDEELGDEVGGYRWRFASVGATVTAPGGGTESKSSKKRKAAWLEFREKLYDPNAPHIYKNGNRLRDYQVEGVNWLASTYYRKHGCILADGT